MSRMTRGKFLTVCASAWFAGGRWFGTRTPTNCEAAAALTHAHAARVIQHTAELPSDRAPVVTGVALSPDSQTLATAGDDHLVRLWRVADGELLKILKGHSDWVRCTVFSPDGSTLATAGDDRRARLWNVATGKLSVSLPEQPLAIRCVRFNPQGNMLGTAGSDEQVRLYDVATAKLQHSFTASCPDLRAVAFSRDGELLAAGGRDGQLRLWNLATANATTSSANQTSGASSRIVPGSPAPRSAAHALRLRAIAFSPDGTLLATAGEDRVLRIWELASGAEHAKFTVAGSKIMALAWCGAECVAVGGSDNLIHLFDASAQAELAVLSGHTGTIAALDADPAGRMLVSGSFDTTARIWNLEQLAAGATTARAKAQPAQAQLEKQLPLQRQSVLPAANERQSTSATPLKHSPAPQGAPAELGPPAIGPAARHSVAPGGAQEPVKSQYR
jgi:WD40 repeat protein